MEPTSLTGPTITTSRRCTKKKATRSIAHMKCIERADGRPPNRWTSQGHAASTAGDIVKPVRIIRGIRANKTVRYENFWSVLY
jgi:hypothetical protein